MIKVNFNNVLKQRIGSKHGIAKAALKKWTEKEQKNLDKIFKLKAKPGYAFTTLPNEAKTLTAIKRYVAAQKKEKWENIVVLGIGGSALGLITLKDALLDEFSQKTRLYVLDNVDPVVTGRVLNGVKLAKTLFVVISKSGTTSEPMALYGAVKEILYKKLPKTYQKHLVFVTDAKKGLLRQIAKEEKITTFPIPDKIGGRFSVLTNVGLLPAALAGMNINKLMLGAKTMRDRIKKAKGLENPALVLAATQHLMDRKKNKSMTILMPYSNLLFRMGDWYRQLLAESLGKNKKTGPTPINALGTTDQHSQVQLYIEGPNNKLIIFMRVIKNALNPGIGHHLPEKIGFLNHKKINDVLDASYTGTSESLADKGRPNITLDIPRVNEENLGALFMLFEFQIALLGLTYKVNAFDQPGVEHGKILTKKILSEKD